MMCDSCVIVLYVLFVFFKQKTAYEVRISDWSSDVCSSDLRWGQLLWHVFYRGDEDPDPHDHPWDFWTRPLFQGYYEELMEHDGTLRRKIGRASCRERVCQYV